MITKIGIDWLYHTPLTDEDKQLFREEYGLPDDADIDKRNWLRTGVGLNIGATAPMMYSMNSMMTGKLGRGIAGSLATLGAGAAGAIYARRKYSKGEADRLRAKRMEQAPTE